MMRLGTSIASVVAAIVLSACQMGAPLEQSAEDIARAQAKSVVNGVVAQKLPGVNAAPVTDCIIDSAKLSEIFTIAKGTVVGVTDETVSTVMGVAQRPETVRCIAQNGLSLL